MHTRSTRQYSLPKSASKSTAQLVAQCDTNHVNGSTLSAQSVPSTTAIPEVPDLLEIKTDLESILPTVQDRIRHMESDLISLDQNQEDEEEAGKEEDYIATPDTENNSNQKEADDIFDPSHMFENGDKQAALSLLKKNRKREEAVSDSCSINLQQQLSTTDEEQNESALQVKLKKLNGLQLSPSTTPPPSSTTEPTPEPPTPTSSATTPSKNMKHTRTTHTRLKINHAQAQKRQQQQQQGEQPPLNKQAEGEQEVFVPVKPSHQIPITTFYTYTEPYFRNLTEEDRNFLMQKTEDQKYYLIPPLGRHYSIKWAEEDQELGISTTESASSAIISSSSSSSPHKHVRKNSHGRNDYSQKTNHEVDTNVDEEEGSSTTHGFGSLTDRLIASLVKENILSSDEEEDDEEDEADDDDDDDDEVEDEETIEGRKEGQDSFQNNGMEGKDGLSETDSILTADILDKYSPFSLFQLKADPTAEILDFEERLRRELRYAGLLTDDDIDLDAREDDEICAELRKLHRDYKEQVKVNELKKKRILEIVDFQLQYEQYRQVLDNIDSQVEQGYIKRCRVPKSKKRKSGGTRSALSETLVAAMEKRRMWTEALGTIFKDKNMAMPRQSIYGDIDTDTNEQHPLSTPLAPNT